MKRIKTLLFTLPLTCFLILSSFVVAKGDPSRFYRQTIKVANDNSNDLELTFNGKVTRVKLTTRTNKTESEAAIDKDGKAVFAQNTFGPLKKGDLVDIDFEPEQGKDANIRSGIWTDNGNDNGNIVIISKKPMLLSLLTATNALWSRSLESQFEILTEGECRNILRANSQNVETASSLAARFNLLIISFFSRMKSRL